MPTILKRKSPWDFEDALKLLHEPSQQHSLEVKAKPKPRAALGDFSSLWQALGAKPEPNTDPYLDPNQPPAPLLKEDVYASDGGCISSRKNVSWKEQPEYLETTDDPATQTSEDGAENGSTEASTKTQKRSARRRRAKLKRRQEEEEEEDGLGRRRKAVSDIESEAETPATKASKHTQQPTIQVMKRDSSQTIEPISKTKEKGNAANSPEISTSGNSKETPKKLTHNLFSGHITPTSVAYRPQSKPQVQGSNQLLMYSAQSTAIAQPMHTRSQSVPKPLIRSHMRKRTTSVVKNAVSAPPTFFTHQYTTLPNSIENAYIHSDKQINQISVHDALEELSIEIIEQDNILTVFPRLPFEILVREERNLQLLLRLIHVFGEDKHWLTNPVPMADHNTNPLGIHVFVDFSNIWIGFMEHLKSLQQTLKQRIPHQNLSFGALVLLLERKRPVTNRILAGSNGLLPEVELANRIGYETLILEKVFKAREMSQPNRKFQTVQSHSSLEALGIQGLSGECPTPEKWGEQAVDEVLHLRMLMSVVDYAPSTMVVATGDGAQAEYSDGFKRMIERALNHGWCVELVAFRKNISHEYYIHGFQSKWQGKFRIIYLDEWAQYLLDT